MGAGAGALGGGAAGVAIGAVGGPVGAAVGLVIGAVAGAFAGKGVAEAIDPTGDQTLLDENGEPYAPGSESESHQRAYRAGLQGYATRGGIGTFEEAEDRLRSEYETSAGRSHGTEAPESSVSSPGNPLGWHEVRPAAEAGWRRAQTSASTVHGNQYAENVSDEVIATAAYYIWEKRVRTSAPGDALQDWLEAEREIYSARPFTRAAETAR